MKRFQMPENLPKEFEPNGVYYLDRIKNRLLREKEVRDITKRLGLNSFEAPSPEAKIFLGSLAVVEKLGRYFYFRKDSFTCIN